MNKNIVWWILGVVIVIVGVSAFMRKAPEPTALDNAQTTATTPGEATPGGVKPAATKTPVKKTTGTKPSNTSPSSILPTAKMSLKQIIALGRGQKCAFVDTSTSIVLQGTVYVNAGKVRADYIVPGYGTANSHMMIFGQDVYVWQDAMTTGYKTVLGAAEAPAAKAGVQGLSLERQLGYRCEEWPLDPSKFVLPSSITFSTPQ